MMNQQAANKLSWRHLAALHFSALLDALISMGGLLLAAIIFYWIGADPDQATGQMTLRLVTLLGVLIPAVVTLVEVSTRTRMICVACYTVFVLAFLRQYLASGEAAHLIPDELEAFFAVLLVAICIELAFFHTVLTAPQGTATKKPEFSWMNLGAKVLIQLLVQPIVCLVLSLSVAAMLHLFYLSEGEREIDRWITLSVGSMIVFWLLTASAQFVHVLALHRFSSFDPKAIVSRSPNPIFLIAWVTGCASIMVTPMVNVFLGSTTVGFFVTLAFVLPIAVYIARRVYRYACFKRDYRNKVLRPMNRIALWGFERADAVGP